MSMGMGNYEELLATFAEWLKWLREKKTTLEAQKLKQDAAKKKPGSEAATVAAFSGDDFTRLAGMGDDAPEAPVVPAVEEEQPAEEAKTISEAPVAPVVVAEPPAEAAETIPEAPVAPVVAEPPAKKVTGFSIAAVSKEPAPAPQPEQAPAEDDLV